MLILRTKVRLGEYVRLLSGSELAVIAAYQMCDGMFFLGRSVDGVEYSFTLDSVNPTSLPPTQSLVEWAFFPGQQITLSNVKTKNLPAVVIAAGMHIDLGKIYLVQSTEGIHHAFENDICAFNSEKIPKFLESFSTLADEPLSQKTAKG